MSSDLRLVVFITMSMNGDKACPLTQYSSSPRTFTRSVYISPRKYPPYLFTVLGPQKPVNDLFALSKEQISLSPVDKGSSVVDKVE